MIEFKDPVAEHIKAFILDETAMQIDNGEFSSEPAWSELKEQGTRIWLQGCSFRAAEVWTNDMDAYFFDMGQLFRALRQDKEGREIEEANSLLKGLPESERIKEIFFILNARHAMRISKQLGARVSVEIPVLPGGPDETRQYGQRLFQICPEHITLVLPFCPEGVQAAADLSLEGIPLTIYGIDSPEEALKAARQAEPTRLMLTPRNGLNATELAVHAANLLADNGTGAGMPELIASGLTSPDEIRTLTGFPLLNLQVDLAHRYQQENPAPDSAKKRTPAAEHPVNADSGERGDDPRILKRRRYTGTYAHIVKMIISAIETI